jgi:hypothetical protein
MTVMELSKRELQLLVIAMRSSQFSVDDQKEAYELHLKLLEAYKSKG